MDTSSEKINNDGAAQPAAQEKQVPHTAAPAEQTPDEPMGWEEVATRRQRGRDAVEAASPKSQPARKDMRTQRQEGPLTAAPASDKQKQTTAPPSGSAAGQPVATQRAGQKPPSPTKKKNGKEPAAGAGSGAPPPSKVPFTASAQPTISAWTRKTKDMEVEKANQGRQQAVPAADAAGLTSEAAKARQGKKDADQWPQLTLRPRQQKWRRNSWRHPRKWRR